MNTRILTKSKIYLSIVPLLVTVVFTLPAVAQRSMSTSNAHSHNDYDRTDAFYAAYRSEFGSLEADVHLKEAVLYVAHDDAGIEKERTLEALYLQPLEKILKKNKGKVYADKNKQMQLLIDIKTEAIPTLDALVALLKNYPLIMSSNRVKLVISGNRPLPSAYATYPSFIWFDGRPAEEYDPAASKKLGLISDNYYRYARWNGTGTIAEKEKLALKAVIEKAHVMGKPFRFWATPDTEASWALCMELGVDFINTDKVNALANFIKTVPRRNP